MIIYTGIGSRETPVEILSTMEFIAKKHIEKGWILRSGGAPGADQAFEWGVAESGLPKYHIQEKVEIYLPWANFEKENRTWILPRLEKPQKEAYIIAAEYHPAWHRLSYGAKALMARNVHQVLGPDVNNPVVSDFIFCWTEGGKEKGGTAQALRIAKDYNVSVYNLGNENQYDEIVDRMLFV